MKFLALTTYDGVSLRLHVKAAEGGGLQDLVQPEEVQPPAPARDRRVLEVSEFKNFRFFLLKLFRPPLQ